MPGDIGQSFSFFFQLFFSQSHPPHLTALVTILLPNSDNHRASDAPVDRRTDARASPRLVQPWPDPDATALLCSCACSFSPMLLQVPSRVASAPTLPAPRQDLSSSCLLALVSTSKNQKPGHGHRLSCARFTLQLAPPQHDPWFTACLGLNLKQQGAFAHPCVSGGPGAVCYAPRGKAPKTQRITSSSQAPPKRVGW